MMKSVNLPYFYVNVTIQSRGRQSYFCAKWINSYFGGKNPNGKEKNQDRTCAEADHCHHRRYPVRPVPSGRLLSLCCNPFRIFQYLSEIYHPADDPCLCDHGYCGSFTGCWEASPDHSGSGLWLHSDRRFRILSGIIQPVPALYEWRCTGSDRSYRRRIPDTVFQYYPESGHGYPFRSCPCLCDGTLPLFHAWKRDGKQPVQRNERFFQDHWQSSSYHYHPAASSLHLRNFHRYDYFRKNICHLKHSLESIPRCDHHASDLYYNPVRDRRYRKQEESFHPDQKSDSGIYHRPWNPVFRSYHSG